MSRPIGSHAGYAVARGTNYWIHRRCAIALSQPFEMALPAGAIVKLSLFARKSLVAKQKLPRAP